MASRIDALVSNVRAQVAPRRSPRGLAATRSAVLLALAMNAGCIVNTPSEDELRTFFVDLRPTDVPDSETRRDTVLSDTVDAALDTSDASPDTNDASPPVDTSADSGVRNDADTGMPVDSDTAVPTDTTSVDSSTPVDTSTDTPTAVDTAPDVPVDVPTVDAGRPCTPTSVVVGHDNVVIASDMRQPPFVVNYAGDDCESLRGSSVPVIITAAGITFPATTIMMTALRPGQAQGMLDLTRPSFAGFPNVTETPATGDAHPLMFTVPLNFDVDTVAPRMTAFTEGGFDPGAGVYSFAFTGDTAGEVIFDVRNSMGVSLLQHGTMTNCTLRRDGTSVGCDALDSLGGPQSCVPIGGRFVCESNRLKFTQPALARTVHRISEEDYSRVMSMTNPSGEVLTVVWTYKDSHGNSSTGTRTTGRAR